ncbi:DUF6924 domain-containing protein [Paenarthrobacter ureafaciens]|uniref:DUF6924 domain-containing protein n=1 Tax=Paenarthrobacter ureafaciens TaxID=37931 RepID=UPI001C4B2A52|nr:hypothetical protein [Paenarthrobacter ureafaciens]
MDDVVPTLPKTDDSLLIRTAFEREETWIKAMLTATSPDDAGFHAYVQVVDDSGWDGVCWEDVRQAVTATGSQASVLFVVDEEALDPGYPILVVDLVGDKGTFRCIASEVGNVENNLNIANMDWEDFAGQVDDDGVFRGFS